MKNRKKKIKRTPKQIREINNKRRLRMEKNNNKIEMILENPSVKSLVYWFTSKELSRHYNGEILSSHLNDFVTELSKENDFSIVTHGKHRILYNEYGLLILKFYQLVDIKGKRMSVTQKNSIELTWIISNPQTRNSGFGKNTMKSLTRLSDKYDTTIELLSDDCKDDETYSDFITTPIPKYFIGNGIDTEKLNKWYRQFGFVDNPMTLDIFHKGKDKSHRHNKIWEKGLSTHLIRPSGSLQVGFRSTSMLGYDGLFRWDSTVKCYEKILNNEYDDKKISKDVECSVKRLPTVTK
jgi:hypothetical protein